MNSLLLNLVWAEIIVPSLLSKLEMAKTEPIVRSKRKSLEEKIKSSF